MTESIILIIDDPLLLSKLESSLQQLDYQPLVATNESDLTRALFKSPVLVMIDLLSEGFDGVTLIKFVKKSKAGPIPILGIEPVDNGLSQPGNSVNTRCDIIVERESLIDQLPQLIKKHKWVLDKSPCQNDAPQLLREGIELFNAGEYFECHEVIEEAWMAETSPVRIMYQGVLQIGVACYHVQNKNWRGAMKLLERGIPKIQRFAPQCMGIDLDQLIADAEAIRHELLRIGQTWSEEFNPTLFPVIHRTSGIKV